MANLVVDVKSLTKSFDGKTVVDHIDMQVEKGEIFGFLGPNGSGKTTTIRMICGLLTADDGTGTCLGYDIIKESEKIKAQVGYMTQHFSLYDDLTVFENLDFVARMYHLSDRNERIQKTCDDLGFPKERLKQLAGNLSGGWKQRLALGAAILHEPEFLLLDEPTAGVDPKARRDFWDTIHDLADNGITTLVSTHYMDEAERCHRLAYLSYGHILARGTADEVIANAGIDTFQVTGKDLGKLTKQLRQIKGIEQVAAFGKTLHVCAPKSANLKKLIKPFDKKPYEWREVVPNLEDVFINFMDKSKDNFG